MHWKHFAPTVDVVIISSISGVFFISLKFLKLLALSSRLIDM